MKKLFAILACIMLNAAAWAQAPNYDYPYLITNSAGYIVNGNMYDIPCFGDWDCDGDQDLMVGVYNYGNIYFYRNIAGAGQSPVFDANMVLQADGVNITVTYG
jgi:hypothetical protein